MTIEELATEIVILGTRIDHIEQTVPPAFDADKAHSDLCSVIKKIEDCLAFIADNRRDIPTYSKVCAYLSQAIVEANMTVRKDINDTESRKWREPKSAE